MVMLLRWVQLRTTTQPWGTFPERSRLSTMGSDDVHIPRPLPSWGSPHLAQHCLFSNLNGLSSKFQGTPQNDWGPLHFLQRWQMGKGSPHLLPSHTPPLPFQLYWHGCSMFRNFQNIHSCYTWKLSQELTTLPSAWIGASEWAGSVCIEHAHGWEMNRHFCFLLGTLNQFQKSPVSTNTALPWRLIMLPSPLPSSGISYVDQRWDGGGGGVDCGGQRCCLFLRFGSLRGLELLPGCPL